VVLADRGAAWCRVRDPRLDEELAATVLPVGGTLIRPDTALEDRTFVPATP
jgi:hypothetical protein